METPDEVERKDADPDLDTAIRALATWAQSAAGDGVRIDERWLFAAARDLGPQYRSVESERETFVRDMVAGAQRLPAIRALQPFAPGTQSSAPEAPGAHPRRMTG